MPIFYSSCLQYHFPEKRLHNSHKKNVVSSVAKNPDFLMKNQHFPKMKGLDLIETGFKLMKQCDLKRIGYVWLVFFNGS